MCSRETITALIYLLVIISETNACNEAEDIFPCKCALTNDKIEVDCSGNGLRSVPENLPERTAVLDFSNNLLQPDRIESLCKYDYLEHVSIAGNHLKMIEPRGLRRCTITESLNFSGNHLETVDKYTLYGLEFTHGLHSLESREFNENTFTYMYGLKTLHMITEQNKISPSLFKKNHIRKLKIILNGATEIPDTLLSPLNTTLIGLTIRSPSIQNLPAKLLSNLKKLKQFSLHVNDLHTISSEFFQHDTIYDSIENISLSGIKSIPRHEFRLLGMLRHLEIHGTVDMPSDLFDGLLGLESLDLSTSSVSTIPSGWFDDLWSLQTLDLQNVGLTQLKKEDFKNLHAIKELDLSKNRLRFLNPELFHYISDSAQFINISENILKTIPTNLFKQHAVLEFLDLSKNQLYSIENGAFDHLSELKRLNLQSNKLYDLDAATFVYNVNMTYLDMSSNKLIDLPAGLFGSTHRLSVFNLSDNRIGNLARSIKFYIPSLREINLRYNPVECDCGVEAVKKLLLNALIIGDCEKSRAGIAIVDFVPDTNCFPKSETSSPVKEFISTIDFLHPSENKIAEWESELIISTNDAESLITYDSKLSTASVTSVDVPHSRLELSASREINFIILNNQSSKIKPNDLSTTKQDVSEPGSVVFTTLSITPTHGYSTIKNSTRLTLNESQVYSSSDFVDKTQTTDGINFVSVSSNTEKVHEVSSVTSYPLTTKQETNEGTSNSTISSDTILEPSFETLSARSDQYLNETLSETPLTKPVLSENATLISADIELISPTRVYRSETKDDNTMTDGFHNSSEATQKSPNATVLPPVAGYGNITGDPEMAGKGEKTDYFYLSLASIVSVAVFSVLILVFLYYKRKRNSEYQVQMRRGINVYNVDESFHEDDGATPNSALCKEVPSIQIESVDDEGNVKLEYYPTSKS